MIRHKKPGRHTLACARTHMQHTHVHKPLLPLFPSVGRRVIPSLSPPFSQVNRVPPFPPFQTPTLIREAAGTKEPAQTLTKQETQKQSKDTPGNLTAPSHTTTTGEGAGWGRVFDSHKDDTRKKKKKKNHEERPAKHLSALSTDRAAWGVPRTKPPI